MGIHSWEENEMSAEPKKQDDKQGQQPSEYGAATGPGTVRLERVLPGPIERVWAYLTEPEKRGKWLASGMMELRVGGRVELVFNHSELSAEKTPPDEFKKYESCSFSHGHITRCEPPRLLSYTWGDAPGEKSEVTFELSASGKDVLLIVTHRRLRDRAEMVGVASGWHSHLGVLDDQLNGREPRPFWTSIVNTKAEYEKRLAR
jgi:uncharacterized protein YndB with AHSA1/START domain